MDTSLFSMSKHICGYVYISQKVISRRDRWLGQLITLPLHNADYKVQ